MGSERKRKTVLEFDIKDIRDGVCILFTNSRSGERFAVCREGTRIKIYPVAEERTVE